MAQGFLGSHGEVLILQNGRSTSAYAGPIEVRIGHQIDKRRPVDLELPDIHASIRRDLQDRQSAEGRHVLVLLADALLQDIQFDRACFLSQFLEGALAVSVAPERGEETNQETARGTQAGP